MIVLDANILIRAVLGRKVRELLERYSQSGIRFLAPDSAFAEAHKHLPALLRRVGRPTEDADSSLDFLRGVVESIDREFYASHEQEARERLRGRDEDDWPVLAAALAMSCPIWTEDTDFFGTGHSVWTTRNIEIFLKSKTSAIEPEE